jgi:hypothetical protein
MPAPPWPEKGTDAYNARIAAMVAGKAKAKIKKAHKALSSQVKARPVTASTAGSGKTTLPSGAEPFDSVIDVGAPSPVAMGGTPQAPVDRKKIKREEFDEEDVCKHVGMVFAMLGSIPGHEHWQREADEVALIGQPATRCLNRLDPELRSRVRELSDPAALVIACCWVIGPSLVKEIADARNGRQRPAQQHQAEARNGAGGPHQGVPAAGPAGATPVPPTGLGIPPIGI